MIEGSCHCLAIRIGIPRKPRTLTECNCSICRRYGALWAYYNATEISVRGARSLMSAYLWGEKGIRFMRCRYCGCVTHWEEARKSTSGRVGINVRNFDPGLWKTIRVRHLDGALTWKYLD
jgi:hypothetical protein